MDSHSEINRIIRTGYSENRHRLLTLIEQVLGLIRFIRPTVIPTERTNTAERKTRKFAKIRSEISDKDAERKKRKRR